MKNNSGILYGVASIPDPLNINQITVANGLTVGSSAVNANEVINGNLTVTGTISGLVNGSTAGPHFSASDATQQYKVTGGNVYELVQSNTATPGFNFLNNASVTTGSTLNAGSLNATTSANATVITKQQNTNIGANAESGFSGLNDAGTALSVVMSGSGNTNRGVVRTAAAAFGIDIDTQGPAKSIRMMTNDIVRGTWTDTGLAMVSLVTSSSVANAASSTDTTAAISTAGGLAVAKDLRVGGVIYGAFGGGATSLATLALTSATGNDLNVSSTANTASTTDATASIYTAGGVSAVKDIRAANVFATSSLTATTATLAGLLSTSSVANSVSKTDTTASISTAGGLSVAKDINATNFIATNTGSFIQLGPQTSNDVYIEWGSSNIPLGVAGTLHFSTPFNQKDLMDINPTGDVTVNFGKVTATQLISTIAAGTAPLVVTSSTVIPNLNASLLNGTTFAAPGPIGAATASTGTFTTITGTTLASTVGTGTAPLTVNSATVVTNLNASLLGGATFAAPGTIGSTTASPGTFTTVTDTLTVSGTPGSASAWYTPATGIWANSALFTAIGAGSSSIAIAPQPGPNQQNVNIQVANYTGTAAGTLYITGPSGTPNILTLTSASSTFPGDLHVTGTLYAGTITGTTTYTAVSAPTMNLTAATGTDLSCQSIADSAAPTGLIEN